MLKRYLFVMAVLIMTRAAAQACDVCATYVAVSAVEGAGRTTVSVHELYSRYDRPSGGGSKFDSSATQLAVGYWLTDRWAVQAGVPYVYRKLDDQSESGIGDATAVLLYRLLDRIVEEKGYRIDVYGGVKMPTGGTDLLRDEREARAAPAAGAMHRHAGGTHDMPATPAAVPAAMDAHSGHAVGHHLAPGSGSWDGILGVKGLLTHGRWLGQGETQYKLRTEGDHGFRHGDEWTWRLGAHYYVIQNDRRSWTLGVEVSGESRGENKVDGQKIGSDKAGAYVGPATSYALRDGLLISAAYDVPVSERDKGVQGAADQRARVTVAWSF